MKSLNIFIFNFSPFTCFSRSHHRLLASKYFPIDDMDYQKKDKIDGSISYELMLKNKLIHSDSSGAYSFMPPLQRTFQKLVKIIDGEMKRIGALKVSMPVLSPQKLWEVSGRWKEMGSELFKLSDKSGGVFCLSPTHEEAITSIVASESPISYKRLPIKLYQIGKKFRDEKRPKHGLLRCREFEMKDLYTFDLSSEKSIETFNEVCGAYQNILSTWLDLPSISVEASSGMMGGSMSKEYHVTSKVGEDILYKCKKCSKAFNKDFLDNNNNNNNSSMNFNCGQGEKCHHKMEQMHGIEVAHAFILDDKYSDPFKARYIDSSGNKKSLVMGCYGIGVSRLMAASIEVLSSPATLKYPILISPYQICIIPQKEGYKADRTYELSISLYDQLEDLTNLRGEVMIDDRLNFSIGQRVKQAVANGFPYVVVVGKKAIQSDGVELFEWIDVNKKETFIFSQGDLVKAASLIPTETII